MQRAVATKMMHGVFCDSHCHLRLASQEEAEAHGVATSATAAGASHAAVTSLVLCGTHPQIDWDLVEAAVTNPACSRRLIGFGVHPWFVPASSPRQSSADALVEDEENTSTGCCCCANSSSTGNYSPANAVARPHLSLSLPRIAEDLAERLQRNPAAIVAEIGLDKLRGPPEAAQTAAFHLQLRIAAAHHRPVSVHCVRHYGLLLRILQDLPAEDTPPAIILHAFTGSLEIAKSLLSLKNKKPARQIPADESGKSAKRGGASADAVRMKERIFFGVGLATSFAVKNFGTQTLPLLLQSQRVLLETDAHYSGEAGWGSGTATDDCEARTCVYVDAQQHAEQLRGVMEAIEAAALQSAELVKAAADSGVTADEVARKAVAAAYTNAFRSVLL